MYIWIYIYIYVSTSCTTPVYDPLRVDSGPLPTLADATTTPGVPSNAKPHLMCVLY